MEVNLIKNLKSNDKSPSFYQIYPELFYAFFRNIDKDVVNRLSDAGYLYYQSILCLDSIIDRKEGSSLPMFITLQEEAVKILTDIFGCESIFWDFLNKRKHELFESVKLENSLSYNDKQSWAKYKEVADKKAAIAKVAIDGMYILSNKLNKNVYHLLLKSQKYFSIGFQLYDDLKDFEDDYNQKQFNWVFFILNKIVDVQQYNLQTLHKLLFVKGIAVKILDKSIHFFEKAEQIILPLNIQSKWIEAIRETKKEVQQYLDITTGYVETVSTRVELSLSKRTKDYFFDFSSVKDLQIKKSLDFIYNDYKRNYAELKHVMYLSQIEGFNNRQQIHVSDIFQRTLLNDSLITVFSKYNLDANEYLDDEIKYLLSNMNNDSIGVWKYFPTVDEIAADIDDLGIAMQFFINSSHKEIIDNDPTGSRRFICMEVDKKIDCSPIDHAQIYAQLKEEIEDGKRYWFEEDEEAEIMVHNAAYQRNTIEADVFDTLFRKPVGNEKTIKLSAREIYDEMRATDKEAMKGVKESKVWGLLKDLDYHKEHFEDGNKYNVVKI